MIKIAWKKIILTVLAAFAVILLICCTVIPRFQKKVTALGEPPYPVDLGESNERVLCVDDNDEALLWRLKVIREAKKELVFATYSFLDDESGRDIMSALLNASERGVNVKIIVDGVTSLCDLQKSKNFQALSAADHVEVRVYNPVNLLKPWALNYRMHDKYLVADDTVYMLGGRNTKNLSLGAYPGKKDVDRDMLVYSLKADGRNSLAQVKDYFEQVWALPSTKSFPVSRQNHEQAAQMLHEHYESLSKTDPDAFRQTDWTGCTMPTKGIRLLTNPIEPWNKEPKLWSSLIQLMEQGQESLVQTPYLICSKPMYDDLTDLTQKGKKTEIILNSIETGANLFGAADYLNEKRNIQSTGVHIYEYMGQNSSHTKTVLIDRNLSLVGSFNFDMRSAYLDTEMMLVIDCPALNHHLRTIGEQQKNESRHLAPDGTVSLGADCQNPKLTFSKHLLYGLMRAVLWPFRHLM